MAKVLIAMSGGVDSSVAACMLKEMGHECIGATMRLYHRAQGEAAQTRTCCADKDIEDAARVCLQLGIPYEVIDYVADFEAWVIDKFIRTYEQGGTPNPCIDCNRYLKFEKLMQAARERGCEYIATGHYARVSHQAAGGGEAAPGGSAAAEAGERMLLRKAAVLEKDQSYVLYALTQAQLLHTLFPLGELGKDEVRRIALSHGFKNADKPDSQDICFVPDGDYAGFIERRGGAAYPPGDFIDPEGRALGRHRGIIHYTIGQRKGLGIASELPYYVTAIDPESNTVTLSHGEGLHRDTVELCDVNLISIPRVKGELRVKAKLRYRQTEQPAVLTQPEEGRLLLRFDEPQRAVTRGQAAVIYDGDVVVGGGTIM